MTPDVTFPGSACYFQNKFGLGTRRRARRARTVCRVPHGADDRRQLPAQRGIYRNVLLAAGEVHSAGLDYSERGEAIARLYGDGAAAVVLADRAGDCGLESIVCHSDGRHHERFWIEYPSSRQHPLRVTVENLRAGMHFPRLDLDHVERFGVERLPAVVREALAAADTTADASTASSSVTCCRGSSSRAPRPCAFRPAA